ncbi:MAG: hypothetical protein ACI9VR_000716 [Cognaticolwellia sp.]|jgi:hypothetical protein
MNLTKTLKRKLPALTLLLALIGLPQTASAESEPQQDMSAFFASSFDYCDAKLMAGFWGEGVSEAKGTISYKLGIGGEDLVRSSLKMAREKALQTSSPTCSIYEMGYAPADAEALAKYFNYSSTSEAKAAMFNKMLNQGEPALIEVLKAAGAPSVSVKPAAPAITDPFQAFMASRFDYCDAKVLGELWSVPVDESKTRIGTKMISGYETIVSSELDQAFGTAGHVECVWPELDYSYTDAEAMAAVWGHSTEEAKTRMTRKVNFGNRVLLDRMVKEATQGK